MQRGERSEAPWEKLHGQVLKRVELEELGELDQLYQQPFAALHARQSAMDQAQFDGEYQQLCAQYSEVRQWLGEFQHQQRAQTMSVEQACQALIAAAGGLDTAETRLDAAQVLKMTRGACDELLKQHKQCRGYSSSKAQLQHRLMVFLVNHPEVAAFIRSQLTH